jgi:hypothetical protein
MLRLAINSLLIFSCLYPTLNYGQEPIVFSQNNKIYLAINDDDCIILSDSINYIAFFPQWAFFGDTLKTVSFHNPFAYKYQTFIIEDRKFRLTETISIDAQWFNKRDEDISSIWMGSLGNMHIFFKDGTFIRLSYSSHIRSFASSPKNGSRKP